MQANIPTPMTQDQLNALAEQVWQLREQFTKSKTFLLESASPSYNAFQTLYYCLKQMASMEDVPKDIKQSEDLGILFK